MKRLSVTSGIVFAFLMSTSGILSALEEGNIVGVLARPAKLYDAPYGKANVIGEWPANLDFGNQPKQILDIRDNFVQAEHEGRKVWVMLRAVKADRKIRIAEACGAMPTDVVPRSAATRGIGEHCK